MQNKTIWRYVVLLFIATIAILLVYLVVQLSRRASLVKESAQNQQTQDQELVGKMGLISATGKNGFSVGETVVVTVTADSASIPVTGYDAVIMYDPAVLRFESAKSLLDTFDFFATPKEGAISLTGGLKISPNNPQQISDSVLANISLTALKNGNANFDFFFHRGETVDSNLLSDKTKDILGEVSTVQIVVGQSYTLLLNKQVEIGDSTLTLLESTIPASTCQDCQSIVNITVEKNGESQVLEFINGGFDGRVERQKKVGDTTYELENSTTTSVILNILQ